MSETDNHRKLVAWQESMKLAEMVYQVTATFPKEELYGLSAQMRRAAISVPSNIAEGAGRNSARELIQFVGIANGSLAELETQLELAIRLGYLNSESNCVEQVARVGRLLVGLRKSLKQRNA